MTPQITCGERRESAVLADLVQRQARAFPTGRLF
jgi:hypothetical protein